MIHRNPLKIRILTLLLLLCSATVAASSTATGQSSAIPADAQSITEGAKHFAIHCGNAYCHGTGGLGGGAPRLRDQGIEASHAFNSILNGIPGRSMPAFKGVLSEDQILKVVAFILSDSKTTPAVAPGSGPTGVATTTPSLAISLPNPPASLLGSSQSGRNIFFDSSKSKSCYFCHSFNGEGTSVGPDLSALANKSPRELFLSIILPRDAGDSRFSSITVSLRNGDRVTGVKKDEDAESLRIYDTTELPAVLRTVQKENVIKIEPAKVSAMPADYAAIYSLKQMLDLVTFLKSPKSNSTVSLKDLFQ